MGDVVPSARKSTGGLVEKGDKREGVKRGNKGNIGKKAIREVARVSSQ